LIYLKQCFDFGKRNLLYIFILSTKTESFFTNFIYGVTIADRQDI